MTIHWQDFDSNTFEPGGASDKPVLLLITAPGCADCKEFLATTLAAPEVIDMIETGFVPVRIDSEKRPDLNDRYGSGSWPTITCLTPSGTVIRKVDDLDPAGFLTSLKSTIDSWRSVPEAIGSDDGTDRTSRDQGVLDNRMVEHIAETIYEKFDTRYGGWGDKSKFFHCQAIDFAMVRAAKHQDERMREIVTTTLNRVHQSALHDPIDGGFFRYSHTVDWQTPNYEKTLETNSQRLLCYLEAYQLFGNDSYRSTAEGIVGWMLNFMLDTKTGAFFGSQDAQIDYYQTDPEMRAGTTPPSLDQTIYTSWNAVAASSLLKASLVLDRPELRDCAMRVLRFLLEHLFDGQGTAYHYWDGTYHLPGMLSDQAYLIGALIDASQHTGNADLLLPAEAIAERVFEQQRAPGGGFFDILHDHGDQASGGHRNRSILDNAVMAEALVRLSHLSRRNELSDEAVMTLESFADDYKEYGYYVAGYGRAVDLIFYPPLTITIIGDRDGEAADNLRRAALSCYVPSRIVQMLDPKHDPILIERSGHRIEETPVAYLSIAKTTKAIARSTDELVEKMTEVEQLRR